VQSDAISRNFEGEKLVVTAFGCIIAICIFYPDKRIFNCAIETEMGGVNEICDVRWKIGVQFLNMNTLNGKNIFDRKLEVMDIDNGYVITNRTVSAPVTEPK